MKSAKDFGGHYAVRGLGFSFSSKDQSLVGKKLTEPSGRDEEFASGAVYSNVALALKTRPVVSIKTRAVSV